MTDLVTSNDISKNKKKLDNQNQVKLYSKKTNCNLFIDSQNNKENQNHEAITPKNENLPTETEKSLTSKQSGKQAVAPIVNECLSKKKKIILFIALGIIVVGLATTLAIILTRHDPSGDVQPIPPVEPIDNFQVSYKKNLFFEYKSTSLRTTSIKLANKTYTDIDNLALSVYFVVSDIENSTNATSEETDLDDYNTLYKAYIILNSYIDTKNDISINYSLNNKSLSDISQENIVPLMKLEFDEKGIKHKKEFSNEMDDSLKSVFSYLSEIIVPLTYSDGNYSDYSRLIYLDQGEIIINQTGYLNSYDGYFENTQKDSITTIDFDDDGYLSNSYIDSSLLISSDSSTSSIPRYGDGRRLTELNENDLNFGSFLIKNSIGISRKEKFENENLLEIINQIDQYTNYESTDSIQDNLRTIRNLKRNILNNYLDKNLTLFTDTVNGIPITLKSSINPGLTEDYARVNFYLCTDKGCSSIYEEDFSSNYAKVMEELIIFSRESKYLLDIFTNEYSNITSEFIDYINLAFNKLKSNIFSTDIENLFDGDKYQYTLTQLPYIFIEKIKNLLQNLKNEDTKIINGKSSLNFNDFSDSISEAVKQFHLKSKNIITEGTKFIESLSSTESNLIRTNCYYSNNTNQSMLDSFKNAKDILSSYQLIEKEKINGGIGDFVNNSKIQCKQEISEILEKLTLFSTKISSNKIQILNATNNENLYTVNNINNLDNTLTNLWDHINKTYIDNVEYFSIVNNTKYFETLDYTNNFQIEIDDFNSKADDIISSYSNDLIIDKSFDEFANFIWEDYINVSSYLSKNVTEFFKFEDQDKEDILKNDFLSENKINETTADLLNLENQFLETYQNEVKNLNNSFNNLKDNTIDYENSLIYYQTNLFKFFKNIQTIYENMNYFNWESDVKTKINSLFDTVSNVQYNNFDLGIKYVKSITEQFPLHKINHCTAAFRTKRDIYYKKFETYTNFLNVNVKNSLQNYLNTYKNLQSYLNNLYLLIPKINYETNEKYTSFISDNITQFAQTTMNELIQNINEFINNLNNLINNRFNLLNEERNNLYATFNTEVTLINSQYHCSFHTDVDSRRTTNSAWTELNPPATTNNHNYLQTSCVYENYIPYENLKVDYFISNISSIQSLILNKENAINQIINNAIESSVIPNIITNYNNYINSIFSNFLGEILFNTTYNKYNDTLSTDINTFFTNFITDLDYEFNQKFSTKYDELRENFTSRPIELSVMIDIMKDNYKNEVENIIKNLNEKLNEGLQYNIQLSYYKIKKILLKSFGNIINNYNKTKLINSKFDSFTTNWINQITNLKESTLSKLTESFNNFTNTTNLGLIIKKSSSNLFGILEQTYTYSDNIDTTLSTLYDKLSEDDYLNNGELYTNEHLLAKVYSFTNIFGYKIKTTYNKIFDENFYNLSENKYKELFDNFELFEDDAIKSEINSYIQNFNDIAIKMFKDKNAQLMSDEIKNYFDFKYSMDDIEKDIDKNYNNLNSPNTNLNINLQTEKNNLINSINYAFNSMTQNLKANSNNFYSNNLTKFTESFNTLTNNIINYADDNCYSVLINYENSIYNEYINFVSEPIDKLINSLKLKQKDNEKLLSTFNITIPLTDTYILFCKTWKNRLIGQVQSIYESRKKKYWGGFSVISENPKKIKDDILNYFNSKYEEFNKVLSNYIKSNSAEIFDFSDSSKNLILENAKKLSRASNKNLFIKSEEKLGLEIPYLTDENITNIISNRIQNVITNTVELQENTADYIQEKIKIYLKNYFDNYVNNFISTVGKLHFNKYNVKTKNNHYLPFYKEVNNSVNEVTIMYDQVLSFLETVSDDLKNKVLNLNNIQTDLPNYGNQILNNIDNSLQNHLNIMQEYIITSYKNHIKSNNILSEFTNNLGINTLLQSDSLNNNNYISLFTKYSTENEINLVTENSKTEINNYLNGSNNYIKEQLDYLTDEVFNEKTIVNLEEEKIKLNEYYLNFITSINEFNSLTYTIPESTKNNLNLYSTETIPSYFNEVNLLITDSIQQESETKVIKDCDEIIKYFTLTQTDPKYKQKIFDLFKEINYNFNIRTNEMSSLLENSSSNFKEDIENNMYKKEISLKEAIDIVDNAQKDGTYSAYYDKKQDDYIITINNSYTELIKEKENILSLNEFDTELENIRINFDSSIKKSYDNIEMLKADESSKNKFKLKLIEIKSKGTLFYNELQNKYNELIENIKNYIEENHENKKDIYNNLFIEILDDKENEILNKVISVNSDPKNKNISGKVNGGNYVDNNPVKYVIIYNLNFSGNLIYTVINKNIIFNLTASSNGNINIEANLTSGKIIGKQTLNGNISDGFISLNSSYTAFEEKLNFLSFKEQNYYNYYRSFNTYTCQATGKSKKYTKTDVCVKDPNEEIQNVDFVCLDGENEEFDYYFSY